jgi:hypothetical protein
MISLLLHSAHMIFKITMMMQMLRTCYLHTSFIFEHWGAWA